MVWRHFALEQQTYTNLGFAFGRTNNDMIDPIEMPFIDPGKRTYPSLQRHRQIADAPFLGREISFRFW